jgi:hypothetical protein
MNLEAAKAVSAKKTKVRILTQKNTCPVYSCYSSKSA